MKKDDLNINIGSKLYGLEKYFQILVDLYNKKKFPKVLLLSGRKGIGKASLINHFLIKIFDNEAYTLNNNTIEDNNKIYQSIINQTNQNIFFLKNNESNLIKLDDIRALKDRVFKSTFNNLNRFFIIDDIEKLSINCSNALLKIIEEPNKNDYFILINNQQNHLIDTISSRCININIFLNNTERINIISELINLNKLTSFIDYENTNISPGQFLRFNSFCLNNKIDNKMDYDNKINQLFKIYKKNKFPIIIDLIFYFTELKFYELSLLDQKNLFKIQEIKKNTLNLIRDLTVYNLNLNTVLNSITNNIKNVR